MKRWMKRSRLRLEGERIEATRQLTREKKELEFVE
jgi:hypothetical protein